MIEQFELIHDEYSAKLTTELLLQLVAETSKDIPSGFTFSRNGVNQELPMIDIAKAVAVALQMGDILPVIRPSQKIPISVGIMKVMDSERGYPLEKPVLAIADWVIKETHSIEEILSGPNVNPNDIIRRAYTQIQNRVTWE